MWNPPDQVSTKEIVGRRAFGKPEKIFSDKEATRYRIDIFFDDRIDTDLSLDRLGVKQPKQEVLDFLTPLGDALGERMDKKFQGWAQIRVGQLKDLHVKRTDAEGEDNPYHAELNRDNFRNTPAARALAFQLSVYASQHDFIERSAP